MEPDVAEVCVRGGTLALVSILACTLGAAPLRAQHADSVEAQRADAVMARVRRLTSGDVGQARTLADSLVQALPPTSSALPEALFAKASIAASAADAERDYTRIVTDFRFAPRVPDALMRLAVLESARNNRAGALKHLERLLRDHSDAPARARASLLAGRIRMDMNDPARGCELLAAAYASATTLERDVRDQAVTAGARCPEPVEAIAARDPAPMGVVRAPRETPPAVATRPGRAAPVVRTAPTATTKPVTPAAPAPTPVTPPVTTRSQPAPTTQSPPTQSPPAPPAQSQPAPVTQSQPAPTTPTPPVPATQSQPAPAPAPAPVTPAPVTPAPVTPAPVTPAPTVAARRDTIPTATPAPAPVTAPVPRRDTVMTVRTPTAPTAPAPVTPQATSTITTSVGDNPGPSRGNEFAVQFAAYNDKPGADRYAQVLRGRGIVARVQGTQAPFRVRAGRYATRAEAEAAASVWRRPGTAAIVVPFVIPPP